MSIKSLFENIANAIKNVYGTTDTLTPAEMPEAITNFNSIFQTKNLSAPISGQTTVEGCLSSLSSDLSGLGEKVDGDDNYVILRTSRLDPAAAIYGYKEVKDNHKEVTLDFRKTNANGSISDRLYITQLNDANDKRLHIAAAMDNQTLTNDILPTLKDVIPVRSEDYDTTVAANGGDWLSIDLYNQGADVNKPQFINGAGVNGPSGISGGWRYTLFLAENFVLVIAVGFTQSSGVGMWLNAYNNNLPSKWIGWKSVNMS